MAEQTSSGPADLAGPAGDPSAVAVIRTGSVTPGPVSGRSGRPEQSEQAEQAGEPSSGGSGAFRGRRLLVHAVVGAVLVTGGAALWLTRPSMLDTDDIAATLGQRLSRQVGVAVTVSCPDTVHRQRGETFRCTATTASGEHRRVVVTITDDDGGYTWRTVQ